MQGLSHILIILFLSTTLLCAQSPHGPNLKIDCSSCHSPESWAMNKSSTAKFSHDSTGFRLAGQHSTQDCKSCHKSLIFEKTENTCFSCHQDVHQNTVGITCERCHNAKSWFIDNIQEVHNKTSFPLIGVHKTNDCILCHKSETNLKFNLQGINCKDCHLVDFINAKSPDHKKNNFSNNCIDCHNTSTSDWKTDKVDHSFFPLENGHSGLECKTCHKKENLSDISSACVDCHQTNFDNTKSPNHRNSVFSTDCKSCHTTALHWMPASFKEHDLSFPIYSRKHKGVWTNCSECHTNSSDYKIYTCISCHKPNETNDKHNQVSGYTYEDQACLACHPKGDADQAFDHNNTQFPLTGAHQTVDCKKCHITGFKGTPTDCIVCHENDFNSTKDPQHKKLGFSNNCIECHTTTAGWQPAKLKNHDLYFPIQGIHKTFEDDCKKCHTNGFTNTPNTCVGCHIEDYNQTINPNHKSAQFPNECATCHTQQSWIPSTFDHDGKNFPIYSGKHKGVWNNCTECHNVPNNFAQFTCISCHKNPVTDQVHQGVNGYFYQDNACFACHPTGDADFKFDHNTTGFPLTGAHQQTSCIECHSTGFKNTSSQCVSCHQDDFNNSVNPNHKKLGLTNDCASCHTTNPGWQPAKFEVHNHYYVLQDAHALIANDCKACHNGSYINTPNTCIGCHKSDYENTTDPNHKVANFSNECLDCHTQKAWIPASFDHDGKYFPVYSGKHKGVWTQCIECHNQVSDYKQFTCISCHKNPETDEKHNKVNGYIYQDGACFSCHPSGDADIKFDHNTTAFPLTGAHQTVDCKNCHISGFKGTTTVCVNCHQADFDKSINPDHKKLNLPTDCINCHTTNPGWAPAKFDIHNQFYVLQDAHALIANDCKSCHKNDFNNTPNTCVGCHQTDYNNTKNPNHLNAMFPNECASCHSQKTWIPSTFDHDGKNFPINSGKHKGVWMQCIECHDNPGDFTKFTCISCHKNPETDQKHNMVFGYYYQSDACFACHPTGDADFKFDHNNTMFPLTGAHTNLECKLCHAKGFKDTKSTCVSCHQNDFDNSLNPSHKKLNLSTDCITCHTTSPGWAPASFDIHDNYFVLDGAHKPIAKDCKSCHNGDYNNTSKDCVSCHQKDYDNSLDPSHKNLKIPTDCASCHTTSPGWSPATFDIHDNYYVLKGAHKDIAKDCKLCHSNGYNNTPNTCVACHDDDYKNTKNPNHLAGQFPNDCASCHTEKSWMPSTFNHDGMYFPIYSGAHKMTWTQCSECHTNPSDYKLFTCISCHKNPETDNDHVGVGGYAYESSACLACHPTGKKDMAFDHNQSQFPLTGAHLTVDCKECHKNGYKNTPIECKACHQPDYDGSTDPSHTKLNLSTDCATCHTTAAGWAPAKFDNHDNFYPLTGAHKAIASDCFVCHKGSYNNTPNTCQGCHMPDYNNSLNPKHPTLNIPTDCASCHTTTPGWAPATFSIHDNYYALTGAHIPIKNDCFICHKGDYNNTPNTCQGCHMPDYNNSQNPKHLTLNFPTNCATCHTTAAGWSPATFDIHDNYYPLTGAHAQIKNDCNACHKGNYNNTPNTCQGCHMSDYNNSLNPKHLTLNIPTTCATCHTTNPGWAPATFDIHNNYYQLLGAHAAIKNDCFACHKGDYNNTPNTCYGCHKSDYDNTNNPKHLSAGFPTTCTNCHSQSAWIPSTFDHDNMYFPIYSGKHKNEWNTCSQCHTNSNNYTVFTCFPCHPKGETDNDHQGVNGYSYNSNACYSCHPDGKK